MLEIELEAVGIRLNTKPPDVVFKQKTAGGVSRLFDFVLQDPMS
jgi:ribosome-interacting GTPase 1